MKLNESSNLADPLLLSGCPGGGGVLGGGLGGVIGPGSWGSTTITTSSFGGHHDLISTTTNNSSSTFSEDNLILPPTPSSSSSSSISGGGGKSGTSPPSSAVELDALLIVQSSDTFAELKPLPPFEYSSSNNNNNNNNNNNSTSSIQLTLHNDPHLPQMGSTTTSPNHNQHHHSHSHQTPNNLRHGGSGGSTGGSSIVSSPNSGNFSSSSVGGSPSSLFDTVSSSTTSSSSSLPLPLPPNIKSELAEYILSADIDDIAALIGNAIADSTLPNLGIELDPNGVTSSTIDPWTELDAWIESACSQGPGQTVQQIIGAHNNNVSNVPGGRGGGGSGQQNLLDQDSTIHTSAADHAFLDGNSSSTLQTLLEADSFSGSGGPNNNNNNNIQLYHLQQHLHQNHHHHPDLKAEFQHNHSTSILQSRLQQPIPTQLLRIPGGGGPGSGGPNTSPSQLPESTTHYGLKVDPYTLDHPGSPTYIDPITGEMTQRPHTTHVSPPVVTSTMMSNGSSKYRKQYKLSSKNGGGGGYHHHDGGGGGNNGGFGMSSPFGNQSPYDHHHLQQHQHHSSSHNGLGNQQSKMGIKTKRKSSKMASSSSPSANHTIELDPLGKEKPIHRCGICNRGFLNKSNIKVHLRTHTGEKPFKCEVCGKAFRQKAHLLKHVQIHKRITRD